MAEIKTSLRLKIIKNDGSELKLEDDSYNFKHLVLFESQLKPIAPLKSSYKLENYLEWLDNYFLFNLIIKIGFQNLILEIGLFRIWIIT